MTYTIRMTGCPARGRIGLHIRRQKPISFFLSLGHLTVNVMFIEFHDSHHYRHVVLAKRKHSSKRAR